MFCHESAWVWEGCGREWSNWVGESCSSGASPEVSGGWAGWSGDLGTLIVAEECAISDPGGGGGFTVACGWGGAVSFGVIKSAGSEAPSTGGSTSFSIVPAVLAVMEGVSGTSDDAFVTEGVSGTDVGAFTAPAGGVLYKSVPAKPLRKSWALPVSDKFFIQGVCGIIQDMETL